MIYRIETAVQNGRTYITGYRLVSEKRRPLQEGEVEGPILENGRPPNLRDGNGKLRLAVEPNPERGKRMGRAALAEDDEIDERPVLIVERRQELSPAEIADRAQAARREKVAAALPDLLLAAADGKDIGAEVRKVLGEK